MNQVEYIKLIVSLASLLENLKITSHHAEGERILFKVTRASRNYEAVRLHHISN